MTQCITRRGFLKGAAVTAGVTVLTGSARHSAYAANIRLNTALVGVGGQGGASHGAARGENLVAMCDVDENRMKGLAGKQSQAKTYTDYRRMFDRHKNINATFIAVPDHSHFPAAMRAIALRSGVYVEKPLTHSIWEARTLTLAARRAKVATQMGNQGHFGEGWRSLCEYIWAGAIGDVTLVECSTNRPIWPQGGLERPPYSDPVPAGLDWEAWIGPAPMRPYVEKWREGPHKDKRLYHWFTWRGWWDFGCGALGDMGCHIMDGAFWSMRLASAKTCTIEAESGGNTAEGAPAWSIVTYQFPARGSMPPLTLKWYDGGKRPERPAELEEGRKLDSGGHSIFHGSKGTMIAGCYGGGARIIPESKHRETPKPRETIPRAGDHRGDFVKACKGGPPASSNFDYAGPFTEIVNLGNLAIRLGQKIEYDIVNMKAKNCPNADVLIRRPYRQGWA